MFSLILENIGTLIAVAFVLFNLFAYFVRRFRQNREKERYGHYPPAVRGGRLNYEDYEKRRED
ncbi:hypothetical protein [Candidatus Foliamicus sp.]